MSSVNYESNDLLAQYLLLHYGEEEVLMPYDFGPKSALNFPKRVCEFARAELGSKFSGERALDVGCAVGRASFELGKDFRNVLGLDYSKSFIDAANQLAKGDSLEFSYAEQGEISKRSAASLKALGLKTDSKFNFQVADACALSDELGEFDFILAANLICRLPDPVKFLEKVPSLLQAGGHILITSPYTWIEEITPKANWIGAHENEAGETRSLDALREQFLGKLSLVKSKDIPFLIREHERKYQWSVAEASLWVKA